ncbi:MAG: thiamine pyrophosphate-dependent dehydrogenase E1 component subunit alpha [Clostridiales bacterium]
MEYSNEFLMKLYEELLRCRLFEKKLVDTYALGKIPGHIHSGLGGEACYVGTLATRQQGDYFKNSHRCIAVANLLGVSLETAFSEIMAKRTGNAGGRGGVNHVSQLKYNMLGFSATLACDIGLAGGAAMRLQYDGIDNMAYTFYGDGTSNRGPVHEAMNLAAVWKLPVLFVCDNNQFGISTHVSQGSSVPNPGADRAGAYGMPSEVADGTDVLAVYEAAKRLTDHIRAGKGPAVLECKNYRWRGHFEGDQTPYRDKAVTEEWMKKDSVAKMEKLLLDKKIIDQATIDNMYQQIDDEMERAIAFAEASPAITPEEIYDNLYV